MAYAYEYMYMGPNPQITVQVSICLMLAQEFVIHGGEWYDGKQDKMRCYGDVYCYNVDSGKWTHIIIPNRHVKLVFVHACVSAVIFMHACVLQKKINGGLHCTS